MEIWVDPSVRLNTNALLAALRTRPVFAALDDRVLRFASLADVENQLSVWQKRLSHIARMLHPRGAIPIFVQAIGGCYYGDPQQSLPMLGPAFKIALANVWPLLWEASNAPLRMDNCIDLIETAFVVEQLHALRMAFFQAETGEVIISADVLRMNGPVGDLLIAFNLAFASRGQILRLAHDTNITIIADAPRVIPGIMRRLRGDKGKIEELSECWLSKVSHEEPREFWERLAMLLALFLELFKGMEATEAGPETALMFPNFATRVNEKFTAFSRNIQRSIRWRRDWLAKQDPREHRNLIVDRPIVRVSRDTITYCSSLALMGDAINWFVESSVIGYPGASGVPLSSECFRSLLSEPFERQVEAEMRALGFRAGTVTERGNWRLEQPVDLAVLAAAPPPGEIDVLAVHDSGFIFVLECKVLALPTTGERMRNLMGKLGDDDTEAMRSKVSAKLEWVRRISPCLVSTLIQGGALIVLDRLLPGAASQSSVVDFKMLRATIQNVMQSAA